MRVDVNVDDATANDLPIGERELQVAGASEQAGAVIPQPGFARLPQQGLQLGEEPRQYVLAKRFNRGRHLCRHSPGPSFFLTRSVDFQRVNVHRQGPGSLARIGGDRTEIQTNPNDHGVFLAVCSRQVFSEDTADFLARHHHVVGPFKLHRFTQARIGRCHRACRR